MQPRSDAALVLRCLEGDTDAFGSLVERYEASVYATAFYYVGRYGAAEDVAQEAFWAAYRSLTRLKDPNKLGPWLREITTRTAANWLRKNRSRLSHETPLPHRRTISMEEAFTGKQATTVKWFLPFAKHSMQRAWTARTERRRNSAGRSPRVGSIRWRLPNPVLKPSVRRTRTAGSMRG